LDIEGLFEFLHDLSYLIAICAGNIDVDMDKKQKILETRNLRERALLLLQIMQEFKESLNIQADIRSKLNQKFGHAQRQTILREQLKAIREELGEGDDSSYEEKLSAKIEQAGMPEEAKKIADQELKRLSELGTQSPETHIIRNYLDLLTSLPWNKSSDSKDINLEDARKILDEDHYGLEKVKKKNRSASSCLKIEKRE
jgi:ATP-dependent Lon protease